jgi:hypothetical protein
MNSNELNAESTVSVCLSRFNEQTIILAVTSKLGNNYVITCQNLPFLFSNCFKRKEISRQFLREMFESS